MHPEIEKLIGMALADGQVTEKEREIILRKAEKLELDIDEVDMFLEGRLADNSALIIKESRDVINIDSRKSSEPIIRNFTPKKVTPIAPAQLNKESELKIKIAALEEDRKGLCINVDESYVILKKQYDYLLSQKEKVNQELSLLDAEYSKKSKIYLDKFIGQINMEVSEKYGATTLIIENRDQLIDLDPKKIMQFINNALWDNSSLKLKYDKRRIQFKILMWVGIIVLLIIGNQRYNALLEIGINQNWGMFISCITSAIAYSVSSNYSKLIEENKMNFNGEDLEPIIYGIIPNFKNELAELVNLRDKISGLKMLQNNLKLKDLSVYEKYISLN